MQVIVIARDDDYFFGDGTSGTGKALTHVYFKAGTYAVTLRGSKVLPPFRRRVHVWPAPVETSPLSLGRAVKALAAMDWKKLDRFRIQQMFAYLIVCQQPERWGLLAAVTEHLLAQKDFDLQFRAQLSAARLEALAQLGKVELIRKPITVVGSMRSELAKIGGITPEVLIFSGRNEVSPPNMRLPTWRFG